MTTQDYKSYLRSLKKQGSTYSNKVFIELVNIMDELEEKAEQILQERAVNPLAGF